MTDPFVPTKPGQGGGGAGWVWWPNVGNSPKVTEYAPGYRIITGNGDPYGGAMSVDQAVGYYALMSQQESSHLIDLTRAITGTGPKGAIGATTTQWAWGQAVNGAAAVNASNLDAKMTPWDYLKKWSKQGTGSSAAAAAAYTGPVSSTSSNRNSNVQKIDQSQAKALIQTALQSLNGRSYSKGEVEQFLSQYNADAAANPQVTAGTTHTVSRTDKAGHVSTSTSSSAGSTSGGIDSATEAETFAKSRPDYAEFQTAVPLMNAFMSAIQSPTSGGGF